MRPSDASTRSWNCGSAVCCTASAWRAEPVLSNIRAEIEFTLATGFDAKSSTMLPEAGSISIASIWGGESRRYFVTRAKENDAISTKMGGWLRGSYCTSPMRYPAQNRPHSSRTLF